MDVNFFYNLSETKRYKIYILQSLYDNFNSSKIFLTSFDIKIINVGKELSEKISSVGANRHLDILVSEFIPKLIEQNARQIPAFNHKIVALENMGILLEPALDLNAEKLLAEISKNVHLLILWSEQLSGAGVLSWTNNKETFNFNLTAYEPKTIIYNDEI